MPVRIVYAPYDSARRGERMGAGPLRIRDAGLAERLRADGHVVHEECADHDDVFPAEVHTAFALQARVAAHVKLAVDDGDRPIVVAGNCHTAAMGALAGLGTAQDVGILWLDAHADFNTPETTTSGFLDGMSLAIATGRCWRSMAASVRGFRPVPEDRVILLGARDVEHAEASQLRRSGLTHVREATVRERGVAAALGPALDAIVEAGAKRVYVHVDLDVHDAAEMRANHFAVEGGLSRAEVLEALDFAASRIPIAAAGVTAYDPSHDRDGSACEAAIEVVRRVAGH